MTLTDGCPAVEEIGIDAIEIYFPRNYVKQEDLEQHNGESSGKYTIGLGQSEMGFCADNEDIVSIAMTVTSNLLEKYEIGTDSIGCLIVGTETLIDKSKSVKTALMDLFGDNHDIEGVDVKNACYGGTQALLHAIDWVKSKYAVERRDAIVVLADIAIYEDGPARCTGGAGAIALLIRPNAAIPINRALSSSFVKNSWDFYKPIGAKVSEYPTVDGPNSLTSYVEALESCYATLRNKIKRVYDQDISLEDFDAVFFHCPFTKLVQKGLAILNHIDNHPSSGGLDGVKLLGDRKQMTAAIETADAVWKKKTDQYLVFNRRIGNMYTPSLFSQLVAFLASDESNIDHDNKKNLLFFAYGSGCASTMFSAQVVASESLQKMRSVANGALHRLDERKNFTAQDFTNILAMRERFLVADVPVIPESLDQMSDCLPLFNRTFYLEKIDDKYRRTYGRIELTNGLINGCAH